MSDDNIKDRLAEAQASLTDNQSKRKASFMSRISALFDELAGGDERDEVGKLTRLPRNQAEAKVITEREYMAQLHKTLATKLGLKEIVGYRHNPAIVEMFAACGHSWVADDETPWCAAFIGWGIAETSKRLGVAVEGTRMLNARSYLDWGQKIAFHEIAKGDIVIIPRGNSNWQGHVFVFDHWEGDIMVGLGGNQRNAVNLRTYNPSRARILGIRRVVLG